MNENCALYYPSVEFRNPIWLRQACLIWDYIYRIVPNGYTPKDDEFVKGLIDEGIIINIIPSDMNEVLKKVANKFMSLLNCGYWEAAAFSLYKDHTGVSSKLHKDKVDESLRTYLNKQIFQGIDNNEEYLPIPQEFSALYMAYLANELLIEWNVKEDFSVITDSPALWTGNIFYNFEPVERNLKVFNQRFHIKHEKLGVIIIKSFLPSCLEMSASEFIKVRDQLQAPKTDFLNAMKDISKFIFKESGLERRIEPQFLSSKLKMVKRRMELEMSKHGSVKRVTCAMPVIINDDQLISAINENGENIVTTTLHTITKQNLPPNRYSYLLDIDECFQNLEAQEYTDKRIDECIHQFIVD